MAPGVETGQRAPGKGEELRRHPVTAGIEFGQLLADELIIGEDLIGSLHLPGSLSDLPLSLVEHTEANTGEEILGVRTKGSGKEIHRRFILALLQIGLAQQAIDPVILWVAFQDMEAVGDGFVVSLILEEALNLCAILGKRDLLHPDPPSRWIDLIITKIGGRGDHARADASGPAGAGSLSSGVSVPWSKAPDSAGTRASS